MTKYVYVSIHVSYPIYLATMAIEPLLQAIMDQDLAGVDDYDCDYSTGWQEEALKMSGIGYYTRIAKLLNLRDGDTHLDLGVGGGHLLERLLETKGKVTLVGVDRSPNMLEHAAKRLRRAPSIIKVLGNQRVMTRGHMIRLFPIPKVSLDSNSARTKASKVFLLEDDLSRGSVTRRFIGGRKITSGSFCFPGGGEGGLVESPFPFALEASQDPVQQIQERFRQMRMTVRQRSIGLLSEVIQPGGRLVLADRYGFSDVPEEGKIFPQLIGLFPNLDRYWDGVNHHYEPFGAIKKEGLTYGVSSARVLTDEGRVQEVSPSDDLLDHVKMYLGYHQFRRNDVPYTPDTPPIREFEIEGQKWLL